MRAPLSLIFTVLLAGCGSGNLTSSTSPPFPGDGGHTGAISSGPQIHGDERSRLERYQDCLAGSRKPEHPSERARCSDRAMRPDPDYRRVSFPLTF
jgi:hypothetical protein